MGETSSRSLTNNTTTRSVERTTTQKLPPIPILEKNDQTSAKLWEKIHPIYKDDSRVGPIKDDKLQRSVATIQGPTRRGNERRRIWAIGQSALTEMTKTVRERTNFFTIAPSIRTVQTTFCSRAEQTS